MRKILCSTGALFPRTTPEKYAALGDMADKLNCDGFEFMVAKWGNKEVVCQVSDA